MKWFKHYSNAHTNNSLTKVRMRFGAEGYAIYWYCLELIAGDLGESEQINFELKHDAEVIGFNLKIDTLKVEEIMKYMISIGLFDNAEGKITCMKLAKYFDKKTTRNQTIHRIIDASKSVPDSPPTVPRQVETVRDCLDLSPLDTDTDEDIKNIAQMRFSEFWDIFPKKKDKAKANKSFLKLNPDEKLFSQIMTSLNTQITNDELKKASGEWVAEFPYGASWINGSRWEDEIVINQPKKSRYELL